MTVAARLFAAIFAVVLLGGAALPAWANPALVVDMTTGNVLYSDDAGQPWHPASLTKLMTAYVTFHAIAEGRVGLDTRVVVSRQAWNQAPAKSGLPIGASLSLKDALYVMLVKSANDMAWAIAETVGGGSVTPFLAEMNQTAAAMGLTATHYDNPNGLPDPGQLTSARDLAILAMHIHIDYPAYLPIFDTQRVRIGDHLLKSENDLLTKFQGTTGMKTGFICDSGLNIVATVERNGRRLMAVLLGGSSSRERNEKTAQMFLRALAGGYTDTGKNIMDLSNDLGKPVGDISSEICGRKARAFQAQERKDFPMGLKGQPSYLTDKIPPVIYEVSTANAVGPVPLPRPRPASDMAAADPGPAGGIPQPQPRTAAQR